MRADKARFGALLSVVLVNGLLAATATWAAPSSSIEAKAAARFDVVAHDRVQLRLFLKNMPKGGDLHNHLWGAPYAEDFLAWAAADGQCLTTGAKPEIVTGPCDGPGRTSAKDLGRRDPTLYNRAIDALSMRNYAPGADGATASGHDQFFSTFGRFAASAVRNMGPMITVTRDYAAGDRVSYVESSANPNTMRAFAVAGQADWNGDFEGAFARLAPGLAPMVAEVGREMDAALADADRRQGCAPGVAAKVGPCGVMLGFQPFVERAQPPGFVFAQMLAAFVLVEADPRFVGVNIVNPEDDPISLADYSLHMRMFRFLAARYPKVPLSLHAGELTLGLVSPRDLTFHIREAVEVAGAKRIGHGVDIAYEDDAEGLLARMARDRVAVEINLTSNDVILGVKGADHPIALYRKAGVPVVLSTDDEGVSRIDMTNEYLRAATEHGLRYRDLKGIARDSLEYAFLPGASFWIAKGVRVQACAEAGEVCDAFLAQSVKATAQWRLEQDFETFERSFSNRQGSSRLKSRFTLKRAQ
ncbi:adenosine deaminase family protein [Caulobacter sp. ErkDOM-YI]|uniref:adenosine deaminase family protein n=1 Tax=unclassified Caulobacter TaxID=2648921 RepID=UPI003AF82B22